MIGYRVALLVCVVWFATAAILGVTQWRSGITIDTDLSSLAPPLDIPPMVDQAIARAAQNAAGIVSVMLSSADEDSLENALEDLVGGIDRSPDYSLVDYSASLEQYLTLLQSHGFHIMTPEARKTIRSADDTDLLALAEHNLFRQQAWFRTTSVIHDPWGLINEYALEAANRIPMSIDEVQLRRGGGEKTYFTVQQISLSQAEVSVEGSDAALNRLQQLVEHIEGSHSNVNVMVSGMALFAADSAARARSSITLISVVSTISIVLLLLIIFRNVYALLLPVLAVASGAAVAMVVCNMLFNSLHILTIVFGASLIGVAVDYALHFLYDFRRGSSGSNTNLLRALLISMFTSVIGYSALAFAGLKSLQQIAVFSMVGLATACLVVIVCGPWLVPAQANNDRLLQQGLKWLLPKLSKVPLSLVLIGPLLLFLGVFIIRGGSLTHDDHPKALYRLNPDLVAQEQAVSQASQKFELATFLLVQGNSTQAVFDSIAQVHDGLGEKAEMLLSIADLMPSPTAQAENYQANDKLYGDPQLLAQLEQKYGLELDPENFTERYHHQANSPLLAADLAAAFGPAAPPIWLQKGEEIYSLMLIKTGADLSALRDLSSRLTQVTFLSAVESAQSALKRLRIQGLLFLLVAVGVIGALLAWRFPWRLAMQMVGVPAVAIAITLTVYSLCAVEMNLFHTMALFLVLGLGMDYAIFSVELKERPIQAQSAISLSALTSLLAFGLLGLSDMPAVQAFGLTVLVGNTCNYLVSLCLAAHTNSATDLLR